MITTIIVPVVVLVSVVSLVGRSGKKTGRKKITSGGSPTPASVPVVHSTIYTSGTDVPSGVSTRAVSTAGGVVNTPTIANMSFSASETGGTDKAGIHIGHHHIVIPLV